MVSYATGAMVPVTDAAPKTKVNQIGPGSVVLVLTAALLPYLDSLRYGFVYDDDAQVLAVQAIRSWSFVPKYFFKPIPGLVVRYYRPMFFLWLRLNNSIWNMHAWGWHLTNVMLHAAVCLLVLALLCRYFKDLRCALVGTMVFAVHPAHVETVAWVSGCTDALMALGVLGSLLLWMKYSEAPSAKLRIGSLVCCALALLSKETAVVLPILIWLHAFVGIPGVKGGGEGDDNRLITALAQATPYAGLTVIYLIVRHVVLRGVPETPDWISPWEAMRTVPALLLFYVRHLVWPVASSLFYDLPLVTTIKSLSFWTPLIILALIVIGVWMWYRKEGDWRISSAGFLFLVLIMPVLYIRPFRAEEFVHDRYLYLPVVSLSILVGLICEFLWSEQPRQKLPGLPTIFVAVIGASLALATVVQAQPWQSNLSLYEHAVQIAPNNSMARNNLASEYIIEGRYDKAGDVLRKLLNDHPEMWLANYNYGYLNYRVGNLMMADLYLQRAIQIDQQDPDQYIYLGTTYFKEGRLQEAANELRQGIAREPDGSGYHSALGLVLMKQGDLAAARQELLAELNYHPDNRVARGVLQQLDKQVAARDGAAR